MTNVTPLILEWLVENPLLLRGTYFSVFCVRSCQPNGFSVGFNAESIKYGQVWCIRVRSPWEFRGSRYPSGSHGASATDLPCTGCNFQGRGIDREYGA